MAQRANRKGTGRKATKEKMLKGTANVGEVAVSNIVKGEG